MSLEVVALAEDAWRVCDGAIDDFDARRILGYVEKKAGRYEALSLSPAPLFCGAFRSWDDALRALVDTAAAPSSTASSAASA
jgi:hypothetical protein